MKKLLAALLPALLIAAIAGVLYHRPRGGDRDNLLLITLDTTRADHLGCYGFRDAATPALDALAGGGVKFTRAYCNVPLTLPSHATILTGLYPPEHGLRVNGEKTLGKDVATLAQVFSSRGYRTAAFVAAFVLESRFGLDRGFQIYDDYDAPSPDDRYNDKSMYRYRQGDRVADSAVAWIKKNRRRPFFCWVHFFDPHRPYYPHPQFDKRYPESPYDSEIAFMDAQVGRLLDCLKIHNLLGRTIVIAIGDHGEGLGEHGEVEHGLLLYDCSMRVPLIFSCPQRFPPGTKVGEVVSAVDLFPTILDIFRWAPPQHTSGRSFAARLSGGTLDPRPVYAETEFPLTEYGWSPLYGVISEDWKYVSAPREELFNLKDDPLELKNLMGADADVSERLKAQLASLESSMVTRQAPAAAMDEESRKALASLGYLGGGGKTETGAKPLRDPKDTIGLRNLFIKASADSEKHNKGRAEATLRKLIEESPETYAFRAKLAQLYFDEGRYENAALEFRKIAEMNPDRYGSHYNLGKALLKAGKWTEAIAALRRALEIYPDETSGYNLLGIALIRNGQFEEAEKALRKSLSLKADECDARNNLGNALLALGRFEEAAGEFRLALKLKPDFLEARYNLGLSLRKSGRRREAAREFREVLRLKPGFAPAKRELELSLSQLRKQI